VALDDFLYDSQARAYAATKFIAPVQPFEHAEYLLKVPRLNADAVIAYILNHMLIGFGGGVRARARFVRRKVTYLYAWATLAVILECVTYEVAENFAHAHRITLDSGKRAREFDSAGYFRPAGADHLQRLIKYFVEIDTDEFQIRPSYARKVQEGVQQAVHA
jgi:hypothetical protein